MRMQLCPCPRASLHLATSRAGITSRSSPMEHPLGGQCWMWRCPRAGPGVGGSVLELPVPRGGLPKAYVFEIANHQGTIVHSNLSGNIFVCVCVYVLASNLAMVTQHKWAACPFLSAGASSSSQGPRRGMKGEQMVWGCSEVPVPRAVSSRQAEHAQDQGGLSK